MRAYMVFDSSLGASEGACLVFAHTNREAKNISYHIIQDWFDTEWVDISVIWLKSRDWLFDESISDTPHVIETPRTCTDCLKWGIEFVEGKDICIDCEECHEDE